MRKKTFDLLNNVGELTGIFQRSTNIQGLLHLVVKTIASHMKTEACAVFLLDKSGENLVMRATVGFNPEMIGKLKLRIGEGITGTSLQKLEPICVPKGSEDPNFKYVSGVFEEKYESFLAVPILHSTKKLGVIVLEDTRPDYYTTQDIRALSTIASQLANFLENARMLMELRNTEEKSTHDLNAEGKGNETEKEERKTFYQGRATSGGIAMGKSVMVSDSAEVLFLQLDPTEYAETLDDFQTAVENAKQQLQWLQSHLEEKLSEAGSLIFGSHLLMLSDEQFTGSMRSYIEKGMPPAVAIEQVVNEYIKLFLQSENVQVQEKIHDVKDIGHRILKNLAKERQEDGDYSGQIVVAKNILPSELVKLSAQNVEGFVIFGSGITSHISILARSLEIPAVLLSEEEFFLGAESSFLVLDGYQGTIIIDPESEVIEKYINLQHEMDEKQVENKPAKKMETQCRTSDGTQAELLSNINLISDLKSAQKAGTRGVGLYRSEYLFLVRNDFASEEEQILIYRRLFSEMKPVYFRTMDIGGDKMLSSFETSEENNPFMGLRAIRFALKNPTIFKTQLRALLQAGARKDLKILFPLISGPDDFLEAVDLTKEVIAELESDGLEHNDSPEYGAMIELPSAATMSDAIAEKADFLSVGTNDLVQYILGVDRTNEDVADIYSIYHPAVLKMLKHISDTGKNHSIPVSVCGDSAADETMIHFYFGIGIRQLSVDPRMLVYVRDIIKSIDVKKAEERAGRMLEAKTLAEVRNIISELLQ